MKFAFVQLLVCTLPYFASVKSAEAQQSFTIIYKYIPSKDFGDSFYFEINRPLLAITQHSDHYPVTSIKFLKDSNQHTTICSFDISDTSCVFIQDGFGHEIIAIPNDTLVVGVTKMQKTRGRFMLNDRFHSIWYYTLDYTGKNRYIYSLFDSLSYDQGILKIGNIPLKNLDYNLKTFFDSAKERLEQRVKYMAGYCARHNIPKNIQAFADAEIKSAFYLSLIEPMELLASPYGISNFSKEYLETLAAFSCNWNDETKFFRTNLFSELEYRYFTAYKPFIENNNKRKMEYAYDLINTSVKKESIKEFLLPYLLKSFIETGSPVADSLLSIFQTQYSDLTCYNYLDSLSSVKKRQRSISINQALETSVADLAENTIRIQDLFKDKYVLFDCWATWCKPCIEQIPYTKKIEEKYKDKLVVIYLSFDRDSVAWKKMAATAPGNTFLLNSNFGSAFADYFNINSIPRYLLFSGKGQLINADVPRPAHADAIDKILEKL